MKKKLTIRTRFLFYDFIVTISQFSFWKYFSEYTNNPLLWNLMQIQSQLPVRPIDINIKSHYTPREIYILTNTITLTSYYFPFYIANLYYKSIHITDNLVFYFLTSDTLTLPIFFFARASSEDCLSITYSSRFFSYRS